ncbi:OmpA family protein [soil metagenome]
MKKILFVLSACVTGLSLLAQEKVVINFNSNEYQLTPSAKSILDSVLESGIGTIETIDLYGYCDSIGSFKYNDQLSLNRVKIVSTYLSNKGFDVSHITHQSGFGEHQPVLNNSTYENRMKNRRVEIIIIKNSKDQVTINPPATVVPERTLTETIKDSSTDVGNTIVLKNMNFYGGRHILVPSSVPVLLELLEVLKNNPKLKIEIYGHICCTPGPEDGTDVETMTPDLSINRAQAVYLYLEDHGISKKRLSYKGFGHSKPLYYPEDTEEKRSLNRRVEIKIVNK